MVSVVMKHGVGFLDVWSSYFKFLRQLGHFLGLWVCVNNNFGTVLAKSGMKLNHFSTKVSFKLFGNWLKLNWNKENSKRTLELKKILKKQPICPCSW